MKPSPKKQLFWQGGEAGRLEFAGAAKRSAKDKKFGVLCETIRAVKLILIVANNGDTDLVTRGKKME